MQENINTLAYWEDRFNENWEQSSGFMQTAFFSRLACDIMPTEISEEIRSREMSICDAGCACGQGAEVLRNFFDLPTSGFDFSYQAIETAKSLYPDNHYFVADLTKSLDTKYDVVFCSNVLEHMDDPWGTALSLEHASNYYLIIMIPFREPAGMCHEHIHLFDASDIPLFIGKSFLSHAIAIDTSNLEHTLYSGNQILLIYTTNRGTANNLGCLSSSLELLTSATINGQLESNLIKLQESSRMQQEELLQAAEKISQQCETISHQIELIENLNRVIADYETRIPKLLQQVQDMEGSLQKSQITAAEFAKEINALRSSNSWKIGRMATAVPRWIKRRLPR